MESALKGKVVFVLVDSEDTFTLVADAAKVAKYEEENPDADTNEVAWATGKTITAEEQAALPEIRGGISY